MALTATWFVNAEQLYVPIPFMSATQITPSPSFRLLLHTCIATTVLCLWLCIHSDSMIHTACPGMIRGPLPPLARGDVTLFCDPVLLIVPGTGALSLRPHCSPHPAALHLHLLTPSMPSPRSQLSHTARYPTATHHPSKSGSIFVSTVWCQAVQFSRMVGLMHGILFLFVMCPPSDFNVLFRLKTCLLFCSDFSMSNFLYTGYITMCILWFLVLLLLPTLTQSTFDVVCLDWSIV